MEIGNFSGEGSSSGSLNGTRMVKTFFHRLFGAGKIPPLLETALKAESVRLLDEGIRGSVTYRGFARLENASLIDANGSPLR